MHKLIISAFILLSTLAYAQVAIGKTSVTNATVSLEFGVSDVTNGYKGILLPWVSTVAGAPNATYTGLTNPVDGTIIFDISDKKVKYRKAGAWSDLSKNEITTVNGIANYDTTGIINTTLQDNLTENSTAKVMIGGNPSTDATTGILVLADTNKAMILPKMASPHLNIQNPPAGMMAYDTFAKQLAVFNGKVWSFWKP
ncbi:hypothetical protein [Chryseobacterium vrystaatense]|uniref:Uncharacterized protein n=1 Tax=Chryseobacterium vrystaatense TaxID=307480 RepID=A0A1M5H2P1_9FLAO|nr:hypothetical protein [Chryseobacterium vrystaatense]SHG10267.1 hypothetical protein SAMN02787073_3558 [Chryseobacterium vrystaatense]